MIAGRAARDSEGQAALLVLHVLVQDERLGGNLRVYGPFGRRRAMDIRGARTGYGAPGRAGGLWAAGAARAGYGPPGRCDPVPILCPSAVEGRRQMDIVRRRYGALSLRKARVVGAGGERQFQ